MLNIVFCISEGNHKKIEDEFSFHAVNQTFGYEESKLLLDHFLSVLNITAESFVEAKLQLRYYDEISLIDLRKITYIQVQKRIVQVYVSGRKNSFYQAYAKLSDLERCLKKMGFIRVNKSHMVSIGHIKRIVGSEIILTFGQSVKIGREFKNNITELLGNKVVVGVRQ